MATKENERVNLDITSKEEVGRSLRVTRALSNGAEAVHYFPLSTIHFICPTYITIDKWILVKKGII